MCCLQKSIILIFFVLFVNGKTLFAQDSLAESLEYYPLNDGNYWEYLSYSYEDFPPSESHSYFSAQVKGDTVLDDKTYKIIEYCQIPDNHESYSYYERIDSSTGNVFRYAEGVQLPANEFLLDSLLSDSGDTSRSSRWGYLYCQSECSFCLEVLEDSILGVNTTVKTFVDMALRPATVYDLAKGFGLIKSHGGEFYYHYGTTLLYAKISGIEYGEKVNAIEELNQDVPLKYNLDQNYPNPFNSSSVITYNIPQATRVELWLFNPLGEKVRTIYSGIQPGGIHHAVLNGDNLSSGLYFYILRTENKQICRKCILIK